MIVNFCYLEREYSKVLNMNNSSYFEHGTIIREGITCKKIIL